MATITIDKADQDGDQITVTGTVDGNAVTINVWASHLATLATRPLKRAYIAAELKKAYKAAPTSVDLTGTPIILP